LPEHYWASENFALKEPIVDYWLSQLISKINNALFDSPQIQLKTQYQHIHTIDVDNAYFYLGKGKVKNGWRLTKNLFNLNFAQFYLQLQVMVKNKKDPYDTYSYHKDFCESLGIKPIYFIQPGNYGFPDTNISLENPYFIKLIKHIKTFAEIGLHPSYKSNFDFKLLKAEKNALENVIDDEVIRSRQHYLVSDMPNTYLNLSKLGIIEDYSMGYAHDWGFRSGTTHPYYFFDLKKNQKTKLKIYPLGLMDGTLKDYLKLNTSKAEVVSQEVISKYRTYNGTFVSLWHNHTISDSLEWKNWKSVFENQMYAASNQITRSVISTEIHND
jgi:hypothetical protein